MSLAFPVGLPALYFGMLWLNRSRLFDGKGSRGFEMAAFAMNTQGGTTAKEPTGNQTVQGSNN